MEASSSAVKNGVFNGDSWRFRDVANQAKCDSEHSTLWRVMLSQC